MQFETSSQSWGAWTQPVNCTRLEKWETTFVKLERFKMKYGHCKYYDENLWRCLAFCTSISSYIEGSSLCTFAWFTGNVSRNQKNGKPSSLYGWVERQRTALSDIEGDGQKLSNDQKERLNKLGLKGHSVESVSRKRKKADRKSCNDEKDASSKQRAEVSMPPKKRLCRVKKLEEDDTPLSSLKQKQKKVGPNKGVNHDHIDALPRARKPPSIQSSAERGSKVVLGEDRNLVTDYIYFLMSQYQFCRLAEPDRTDESRKKMQIGHGGLQCIHCRDQANPRRFYYTSGDILSSGSFRMANHTINCACCPREIKEKLLRLKRLNEEQRAQKPQGSRLKFFRRVWRRMQGETDPYTSGFQTTPSLLIVKDSHSVLSRITMPSMVPSLVPKRAQGSDARS